MASSDTVASWIVRDRNWSRSGLPMAAVLALLSPFLRRGLGRGAFAVFAQLPIYMVHQYEEHGHGAFKEYGNRELLRGRGRLTDGNIFAINIGGVWGVDLAVLYVARFHNLAIGLLAPYLAIVNGVIHLVAVLQTRRYNPGAWTAGLLFLPTGVWAAAVITREASAGIRDHVRALGGAILLHVVAIALILRSGPTSHDEPQQ